MVYKTNLFEFDIVVSNSEITNINYFGSTLQLLMVQFFVEIIKIILVNLFKFVFLYNKYK